MAKVKIELGNLKVNQKYRALFFHADQRSSQDLQILFWTKEFPIQCVYRLCSIFFNLYGVKLFNMEISLIKVS